MFKIELLLEDPRIESPFTYYIINEPFQLSMITLKWEMNINTRVGCGRNEFIRLLPFHNGKGLKSGTKPLKISLTKKVRD